MTKQPCWAPSHAPPLLQAAPLRGASPHRLSLQGLLDNLATRAGDAGQKARMDAGLLLVRTNVTAAFDMDPGHVQLSQPGFLLQKKKLRDLGGTHCPKKYSKEWELAEVSGR